MSSTKVLLNSNLNAKVITASVNFVGSGIGLLNIPRTTGIAIGNANYVVINNSSGIMTEEQYLNVSRGGTGIDTSNSNGIARVTNGVWTIGYNLVNSDIDNSAEIDRSKIKLGSLNHVIINNNTDGHLTSEAQLATSRGGTGLDATGLSGAVKVVNGQYIIDPDYPDPNSIFDSDINSLAEIQRSKIKLGTLNHVIINNSVDGHLTSEAQLANSRGGTGLDTSSSSGIARITNGTWTIGYNIMNADIHNTAEIERSKIKLGTLNHVIINNGTDGHLTSEQYLSNTRGGTGLNTSSSTGISRVENGTWSVSKLIDNDVDTNAEITRTKMKAANANYVLINDGTGHMTNEQYLSVSRGGTGIDATGLSGIPKVVNGVWSIGTTSSDPNSELGSILDSDISATAEIKRSKIKLGTLNHVIINNSVDGHLTSEAQLANSRGGTGLDTSSSSGIARITNGVWSIGYNLVNADIDNIAEIERSKIKLGTLNHVIINNGTDGHLTSEQYLANSRGGTGLNTSSSTGISRVENGTWSVSKLIDNDVDVNAEIERSKIKLGTLNHVIINNGTDGHLTSEQYLSNTRGGTNINSSTSSGIARITNGNWTIGYNLVNTDIDATAEIDRLKIKLGTLNHVIINNGTDGHLTSEQYLANTRGGTGIDTHTSSGIARVTNGVWTIGYNLVNSDIDNSAEIERSKIKLGSLNHVIINNNTDGHLTSEPQLSTSRGGTGLDATGLTGAVKVINGQYIIDPDYPDPNSIFDSDINPTAEINRSKIKLGTLNHVIINNSVDGHLTSEAQLANSRGGTGLDTSSSSGIARVTDGTWTIGYNLMNADIHNTAEIERSKIKLGTLNHVVINNSVDGHLTSEQYLSVSRGGTGIDATGLSGIPKVVNGVWSIGTTSSDPNNELGSILDSDISATAEIKRSKIKLGTLNHVIINNSTDGHLTSEAYLANSRGGTGINTSSSSGIARVTNGNWSIINLQNDDIDPNAEIHRSKINLGSLNHVIINNSVDGHLTSEAYLANSRGGTGLNTSLSSGIARITNGVWSIGYNLVNTDIDITAEIDRLKIKTGSNNSLIVNDGNGKLSESTFINVASNDLKLNPTNDVVIQSKVLYYDIDKKSSKRTLTLTTSNNSVSDIYTLNTSPNTCYYINFEMIANNNTDNKSGSYAGLIKINQGAIDTLPNVSELINYITILDSEMVGTEVNKTVSNNMVKINVKGVDSKTVKWRMVLKIVAE